MSEICVRPYEPADRDAVRRVCFDTGFMGGSVASQYADFESYADIFSSYYTDSEPEGALVAVLDGKIVGYAFSALDARKVRSPFSIALRHAVTRLACFRPGTWRFYLRAGADVAVDLWQPRRPSFDCARYPSHLHINLLPVARDGHTARELLFRACDRLALAGSPGMHGESLAVNRPMINFWKRTLGGRVVEKPYPVPGLRGPQGERVNLLLGLRDFDTWRVDAWRELDSRRRRRRLRAAAADDGAT